MTYYLYHIPGKKIGITKDLKKRVEEQQGYKPSEYAVIMKTDNIDYISEQEIYLQKFYGYRVDMTPYNKLNCNKNKLNKMKVNVTEQTTTFPCPVNKLKGQLMDNIGLTWETDHADFVINEYSIKWIMANVKTSMFDKERSYVYNKAFARFYDNHDAYDLLGGNLEDVHMRDQYDGKTLAGGMSEQKVPECCDEDNPCTCEPQFSRRPKQKTQFDLIRDWADERGLYEKGDPKTQALKLVEEVGEICRAILKEDHDEVIDGIGDAVVVLTNLAELQGVKIEHCIHVAYNVISQRTGKMVNGTFKKD
jgi:NTP pyrophosphatase (non-canonical NTP hydrolase)